MPENEMPDITRTHDLADDLPNGSDDLPDKSDDLPDRSDDLPDRSDDLPDVSDDLPELPDTLVPLFDFSHQMQHSLDNLLSADTPKDQLETFMMSVCGRMTDIYHSLFRVYRSKMQTLTEKTAANVADREELDGARTALNSEQDELRTAQQKLANDQIKLASDS